MFLGKPKLINLQLMGAAGTMKNKMKSFTHCVCSKRLASHLLNHLGQHKHLHKPPLLSFPLTSSQNTHLKTTFASQRPASAQPPQHSALTSQAPAQARALLLPYHLLTHQGHHKHLHNPPPSSCPNCYTANTDLTSTCTSQLRTPAPSPTAPPLTTYAPAQTRDCLLP